ncbi:ATPase family [compost metagenome]
MAMQQVTPTKLGQILTPLYAAGVPVPTVMQWGPPGVGKSEGVKTLAKSLREITKKKVVITDVRLLLFNPIDLRGIPVPDAEKKFAIWLRPQIFNMDPSPDVINILFLDEITAAPPTVQASAYQLTLDRKVGEHELPDNVIIMAAGNRVADKGVAHKMPTPLANRMTHFEIVAELDDWKEWAIPNGIHEMVLGYLNFQQADLHKFDPAIDDPAFATPRSWTFVSQYLKIYNNVDQAFPMISGSIGQGMAVKFKGFANTYGSLPNVDDILNGRPVQLKNTKMDIMYALSSALVSRAPKATIEQLRNVIKFTITNANNVLPVEFSVLTLKDLLRIQEVKEKLLAVPEWVKWSQEHKEYIH